MPSVNWDSIERRLDAMRRQLGVNMASVESDARMRRYRDWEMITMGARADAGNEFNAGPFAASSYNWGLGPLDRVGSTHCRYCGMILARCGCGYGSE